MPNRFLKESICTSDDIDQMTWFEEVFFYRLIVNCDDFGRFDARPAVLKSRLFPLKERITLKEVSNALTKLANIGIVRLYECDGKPYLYLPTWLVHQTQRATKSKYPDPAEHLKTSENNCFQVKANVTDIRNSYSINDIRYSSIDIRDTEDSVEPDAAASTPPVITLPLNDGSEYPITQEQCQEWAGLYPAVDVIQQLRSMRGWLDSNKSRRKTRKGILRFVNGWLAKEQDKGGVRLNQGYTPEKADRMSFLAQSIREDFERERNGCEAVPLSLSGDVDEL